MFGGMMFRVVWDQLEAWHEQNAKPGARRRRRPRFDFWEFVYPVLPSLALFQGVLWLAGTNELSLQLCLACFQNGFFWHALLAKTKQTVETTGAKVRPGCSRWPPLSSGFWPHRARPIRRNSSI
jgi:hypothetical protein